MEAPSHLFHSSLPSRTTPFNPSLQWIDALPIRPIEVETPLGIREVKALELENTALSCSTHTSAGQWSCRRAFINEVLTDLFQNCPKDQPLAFVSIGSDLLLMEYILGKALIES